jgi:hypothetical protein
MCLQGKRTGVKEKCPLLEKVLQCCIAKVRTKTQTVCVLRVRRYPACYVSSPNRSAYT